MLNKIMSKIELTPYALKNGLITILKLFKNINTISLKPGALIDKNLLELLSKTNIKTINAQFDSYTYYECLVSNLMVHTCFTIVVLVT